MSKSKWKLEGSTGISIGGEYYASDENGVVEIPDNVGGLAEYGFVRFFDEADAAAAAKASQEHAEKIAAENAAREQAEADALAQTEADAAKAEQSKKGAK